VNVISLTLDPPLESKTTFKVFCSSSFFSHLAVNTIFDSISAVSSSVYNFEPLYHPANVYPSLLVSGS